MTDLTPETLYDNWRGGDDETCELVNALRDALAASEAAREEAERELAHAETCWGLETQRATSEKIEKETAEARVAALEAGIKALDEHLARKQQGLHAGSPTVDIASVRGILRALTEKEN